MEVTAQVGKYKYTRLAEAALLRLQRYTGADRIKVPGVLIGKVDRARGDKSKYVGSSLLFLEAQIPKLEQLTGLQSCQGAKPGLQPRLDHELRKYVRGKARAEFD